MSYKNRLTKLREEFKNPKLDAVLISSVSNIIYYTGYSGFSNEEREAFLCITKQNQYIITDARYTEAVKKTAPSFTLLEKTSLNTAKKILHKIKNKEMILKIGIEYDNITLSEDEEIISPVFPDSKHFDLSGLRIIKDEEELLHIQAACALGDKTFNYILSKIKPGMTEKKLAFELEFYIKKNGGDLSFRPIVAFGGNSSVPHHMTGNTILENKQGQFILLDFGVKINNYCSDMTRTIFFGKASEEQKKIYQTVYDAQQKAIDTIDKVRPCNMANLDRISREYIISKGYLSIPHSLGHGIGLEVHEGPSLSPNSKDIAKDNMVFSVEPGIYIPNFGGVRIEDLVVIKNLKPHALTHAPKNLIEL